MQQAATVVPFRANVDDDMFREFADALPQIVWMADPSGKVEFFNQHWYDYTGLDVAQSLGAKGWDEVFHPDDTVVLWQRWPQAVETGELYEIEYRIRGRNGEYRWFLGRGLPVHDAEGNITKWFGTCTDIHDKKMLESQLRQQEAELRLLADALPQMVWMATPDGHHDYYNRRWYEYTGFGAGESIGQRWGVVVHPADEVRCWERWQHALKSGEPYEIEYRLRRQDGEYRWFLGRGVPMCDTNGQIHKWFGTCTDIHDKILAEHQLKQAMEQAEAASMAKTEFLANMSHEIRTPMNAVVGLANILSASHPLTEKQKEYISTLQMSAEQLLQLINDLLDVSRLESNHVHLEAIPFDLNKVVQDVILINQVKAREKNVLVEQRGNRCPGLIGDPLRFKQIVMNLVGNAVKFTNEGSVRVNLFATPRTGSHMVDIVMAVEDTGIGISSDKLGDIFGKFSQAETSTSRRYGGSGLGLSIAKTLVELMGGQITVTSTPSQGSCFTVTMALPAVSAQEASAGRQETDREEKIDRNTPAMKSASKVLLVEDYHANVMVATMLLENYGYPYALASSGEEALKKMEDESFALVLMDVQMPQMNGYQATALIREREAAGAPRTPIIGMTAHALKGDRERCLEAGMDDYLAKPFRPETLKTMLEKYSQPGKTDA